MRVVDIAVPVNAYQLILGVFETAKSFFFGFPGFQIQAFGLFLSSL